MHFDGSPKNPLLLVVLAHFQSKKTPFLLIHWTLFDKIISQKQKFIFEPKKYLWLFLANYAILLNTQIVASLEILAKGGD